MRTTGSRFTCVTGEGVGPLAADCQVILSFIQTNFVDIGKCLCGCFMYLTGSNIVIQIVKQHSPSRLDSQRCSHRVPVNGRGSTQSLPLDSHWKRDSWTWYAFHSSAHHFYQRIDEDHSSSLVLSSRVASSMVTAVASSLRLSLPVNSLSIGCLSGCLYIV